MNPPKSPKSKPVWIGGLVLLVIAAGVGIWLSIKPPGGADGDSASSSRKSAGVTTPGSAVAARPQAGATSRRGSTPATPSDSGDPSEAVAAILADQAIDDATACRRLQELVTSAASPLSERLEALDHLLILTTEADSGRLVALASHPRLPEEVRERLLDDAHNRSGKPQLEILLALLERAKGEQRADLLELLRLLLSEDHGEDLAAWRVAVDSKSFPSP